jgi:flagellar protein FliS
MYGNASSPFASRTQSASMYRKVGLETDVHSASPHRLVSMLFDGIFDAMNQALVAIANNNTTQKNNSLCRAVRILDEGLKSTLNLEAGPLAQDLGDLYAYLCMRLTQANLHGDSARIEECQRLLTPVRDAWNAIAQSPEVQRAA